MFINLTPLVPLYCRQKLGLNSYLKSYFLGIEL